MSSIYPNPWDFSNTDKKLTSPNGLYKIEYGELNEVGMGAPLGGICFCIFPDKTRIKLNEFCGGPVAWETIGEKVALPIWTRSRNEKIAVFDTRDKLLTIFRQTFRVLDLRSFDKNLIYGYDSPIHETSIVQFDTKNEKIDKVIQVD